MRYVARIPIWSRLHINSQWKNIRKVLGGALIIELGNVALINVGTEVK